MKPKIIVIVGPTASGKTALSIELAKRLNGEIISADSRQVYRGLDIGTAKVTPEEMQGIPHHLIDVADPRDVYTVSEYVEDGTKAITEIIAHGNLPIIVGGTFFYIDALLGKITLPDTPPNPLLRKELEELDSTSLYALLCAKDPKYASIVDKENPRRLIRALEIIEVLGHMPQSTSESLYETLTLGVSIEKEVLHERIHNRILSRLEGGMVEEVKRLEAEGVTYERMQDLGLEYRYVSRYINYKIDFETMVRELDVKSRQYAKRQMTWLKRDKEIVWVDPQDIDSIAEKVRIFLQEKS
jgi:tRNA dimethylallyltransferase